MRPGMRAKALVVVMSGGPSDTTAPTVAITADAANICAAAFTATFTFSEEVAGFEVGDITVGNGSAGDFATADNIVYTATITPTAIGNVTVDVDAGVCTDAAGNDNTAATQFVILYGVDVFTRADGAIGAGWTGATWTISSNAALNTPVAGAEDISNGNMETGDPPTGWTAALSAVLDGVADERTGGAGSQSLSKTNNGATYGGATQALQTAGGVWVLVDGWVKRVTDATAGILLRTSGGTTLASVSSTTADTWVNLPFTGFTSGENCYILLGDGNGNGTESRYDDISTAPFTTADLFAVLPSSIANVTAQVVLTVTPGNKHAGLLLNLDSATTPLNYVAAYLTTAEEGALNAYLVKCVNGVISRVAKGVVTFGATKYLKVVKDGNNYSLYYGTTDIQVGTTQTIADMNGTIHGLFSTGAGTFDSYQLSETPANP